MVEPARSRSGLTPQQDSLEHKPNSPMTAKCIAKYILSHFAIPSHPLSQKTPIHRDHRYLPDNSLEPGLVPFDDLVLADLVGRTDGGPGTATLGNALTTAAHADVEVHSVNTDSGVVLDTEIDVLADTEAEVTGLGEVALAELVLLDLEATLEDLLGLGATDGDVNGDLLVTTDTEGTDGVAGLACCDFVSCDSRIYGWDPMKIGLPREEGRTYCKPGFDQKAARAPLRHE